MEHHSVLGRKPGKRDPTVATGRECEPTGDLRLGNEDEEEEEKEEGEEEKEEEDEV